jgi:PPOX class probable F420-dependent enzyme
MLPVVRLEGISRSAVAPERSGRGWEETMQFTPDQERFLSEHKWAVLATGRRDGSPQVSMIGYHWDGEHLLISVKSDTAKWNNALRQPRVALVVHEGRKQLVIYGSAEGVDSDPARLELSKRVFETLTGSKSEIPDEKLRAGLDEGKRTVLRVRPENAYMND